MAYTQAQRDALASAIATGALETDADGVRVRYRSLSDMRSLLAEMDRQLAEVRPVNGPRWRLFTTVVARDL